MEVLFTGTDSVTPEWGDDTAGCVVDGRVMIDFGYHGPCRLAAHGIEPWNLRAGCLTHLHQDHFMGLAPLLFYTYLRQAQRTTPEPLCIIGPAEGIEELVHRAREFLRMGGDALPFPKLDVRPVRPGDRTTLDELTVEVGLSMHNVPSVAYRISRAEQGRCVSVVYSGDTGYCPDLARFAAGADLLVHESARGVADDAPGSAHSSVDDACRVAAEADVKALALVHMPPGVRASVLQRARELLGPNALVPQAGQTLTVTPGGLA